MKRKGVAYILAIMFLALFSTIATVYATSTGMGLAKADNQCNTFQARMASESGLAYLLYEIRQIQIPNGLSGTAMLNSLAGKLQTAWDGSPNLGGQLVTFDGTTIVVPAINTCGQDSRFNMTITLNGTTNVTVRVNGSHALVGRALGVNCKLVAGTSTIFNYGIASKSAIQMTGNASVKGKNNAAEANILSATYTNTTAVALTGNVAIQGDIYTTNPAANISLTGNTSVGGVSGGSAGVSSHIHIGAGGADFPEVAPTVFEPFAVNTVDKNTSITGNKTFTNIRIKAGTNPTFSGNITLQGVIFIEQPNSVQFTGNTNITGVIVTQDAGNNTYSTNTIKFTGNMSATGVENLPDTSDFHVLRTMPGSFILAPGFGLIFTGNFGTVGGCLAADSFSFTGNSGGTIRGGIINYSDSQFSLTGNSSVLIDRSGTPTVPPGFALPSTLSADPDSYVEYVGGQ